MASLNRSRGTGTPVTCGKTLGTSLSLGEWGYEGRCLIALSMTPIPLESGRP